MIRKLLLLCGILSSVLYVAMNVFIAMQWEDYDSASRTVSELSAIGAPTQKIWVFWGSIYALLFLGFAIGIFLSADNNRKLRLVAILAVIYSIAGFAWRYAPMHLREDLAAGRGSLTDNMHIALAFITIALMMLMMGFGAAALRRNFMLFSILSMLVLIVFGLLTAKDVPAMEANLPTPRMGVWERINIGVFILWTAVLAISLLEFKRPSYKTAGIMVKQGSYE